MGWWIYEKRHDSTTATSKEEKGMKIAIDVGHMGKKGRSTDRGVVLNGYREADLVLDYCTVAFKHLEKNGHTVYLLTYNNYSTRQAFCTEISTDVHVQCHINSASAVGRYGRVLYREDNKVNSCVELAEMISDKLSRWVGNVLSKVDVKALKGDDRGYGCLMNDIPSLLFEPMFINNENHLRFMLYENGLTMIGTALATAINEWSNISRGAEGE
jgi:N-acetylmuramoyl-L-alanine amidase